jgi:hypothetical protein
MLRPDRRTTLTHTLSWLFDDLLFYGRGYPPHRRPLPVRLPVLLSWMPYELVNLVTPATEGNFPIGGIDQITVNGVPYPIEDFVIFYSPNAPLLDAGAPERSSPPSYWRSPHSGSLRRRRRSAG